MRFFNSIPEAPVDAIFGLTEAFKNDCRKEKLNLSIGVYRDEHLLPSVMLSVKDAEATLLRKEKNKEYLPIAGDERFIEGLGKLAFGKKWEKQQSKIAAVQTIGGTGALRVGADLLHTHVADHIVTSDPTWPNHRGVFSRAGFAVETYPYYDRIRGTLLFEEMLTAFKKLQPKTVVLLQVTCHNPSGMDLSNEQWKELAGITKKYKLIPFLDCPYQGLGKSLEKDVSAIQAFLETNQEFLLAYSCSKNFSLYCERVGALFINLSSEEEKQRIQSVLKVFVRNSVSNCPAHGARAVAEILHDTTLTSKWKRELEKMRKRILSMRTQLATKLSLPSIAEGNGMFCILPLSVKEIERLRKENAIYMTSDGRINLSGLNQAAIKKLCHALR
jgi:aromatic-amino-acid transaminase